MNTPEPKETRQVSQVVEHLFRHESGKMIATLTRIFGLEHLTLAEDVVQEALIRALQTWPFYGLPENPSAWIMRASRNLALDAVRRQKVFRQKEAEIVHLIERDQPEPNAAALNENEISDDRLRMMFVCCHPLVPEDAQAALALKTLCGFSITEISRAFLTSDAAIAKRLTRAKQKIRDARIPFEIPAAIELAARLDGVLQTLYLLFNEGYKASSGNKLVRQELCHEAIRLGSLLAKHSAGNRPKTHALLALMHFSAARLPARADDAGNLLLLKEQDRSRWDQNLIARGMFHFAQSAAGDEMSVYHLQSAIAACHCAAPNYDATDWPRILELYDQLVGFDENPVIALNRAVAVANVNGPKAGLQSLAAIPSRNKLEEYYLYYAVMGEFEAQLNNPEAAAAHFRKAIELSELESERAFLRKKLNASEEQIASQTAH
ncbi:MAG TPA: sigma-70 family RNA polymerase sigma factor [Verrucomicrobiae bacterium]